MDQFEYMDETSIDDDFKCDICKKPFINPVLLPCQETFCKKCIEENINAHTNNCSQCNQDTLKSMANINVRNPILEKVLGKLLVKCRRCSQNNIQRKDFLKHIEEICPKRIVKCSANDIKCWWQGTYDQFNQHLDQCSYEKLRTLLTDLFKKEKNFEELQSQVIQQQAYINRIENLNQTLTDDITTSKPTIETLTNENQILKTNIKTFTQQIDDFKKLEINHNELIEESKKRLEQIENLKARFQQEIDELKTENIRLKQIEIDSQQLKDDLTELHSLRNVYQLYQVRKEYLQNLQVQYNQLLVEHDELRNVSNMFQELQKQNNLFQKQIDDLQIIEKSYHELRKKFYQNEAQIKQLTIELEQLTIELKRFEKTDQCSQEIDEKSFEFEDNYENIHLQRFLSTKCQIDSLINLNGEKLNDNDIDIVIQTGLITKACHSLVLSSNNLSLNSIRKLSLHLNYNKTLRKLILTNNQLSEAAIQTLADCLAFDNRTLEVLNLSSNQLNGECLVSLSNMLKSNQTIRSIGLHENKLTNQSIEYFSKVMQKFNKTLEDISLYSNEFITDASVQSICDMIKNNQTLKILWIWDCQLSEQGKQQIREAIEDKLSFDLQI